MKQQRAIEEIYEILSRTYPTYDESDDEWMTNGLSDTPFRSIVSVALSTMTASPRCIRAAVALYEKVDSFEQLAVMDDEELRTTIRSVAHYNRKTVNLKRMSRQILEGHAGRVPSTREELMALPGIGRKCTDILLNTMHAETTIAVDTHVRRLVQRLGMVETGLSADDTAHALIEITPPRHQKHAHEWLVQHGMKVCVARRPRCDDCALSTQCDDYRNRMANPPSRDRPGSEHQPSAASS